MKISGESVERDNESIPWERLQEAQRAHEIRMDREVQLSLLTADQIAGTLEERLSLDSDVPAVRQ